MYFQKCREYLTLSRSTKLILLCPYRLLASRTFAFLVGPDKEPIDIHISLLQSLSEPLDKLMNNGQMRESNERVAELGDVDVETFGLFAEFCYTRNYRAPPKAETNKAVEAANTANNEKDMPIAERQTRVINLTTLYCCRCAYVLSYLGAGYQQGSILCTSCNSTNFYCVLCGSAVQTPILWYGGGPFCLACRNKSEVQSLALASSKAALWRHLQAKEYGAMGMSHSELRTHLKQMRPEDELSDKLVYHAKLYIFANMYMIESLKGLCLHKLLRDLEGFDVESDSAGEVAELLRYVYTNTSANDDGTEGTGSELRDLVITYAACKAELLVKDKAFLEMLEEGGEAASAFALFMAKRL